MNEMVHLYDADAKQPLCATSQHGEFAWTADPEDVTCDECARLLGPSETDDADPGDMASDRGSM